MADFLQISRSSRIFIVFIFLVIEGLLTICLCFLGAGVGVFIRVRIIIRSLRLCGWICTRRSCLIRLRCLIRIIIIIIIIGSFISLCCRRPVRNTRRCCHRILHSISLRKGRWSWPSYLLLENHTVRACF